MKKLILPILLSSLFFSGCAEVKVYQRGTLAKQEMSWKPDAMEAAFDNHVYFSKEGSSGGSKTAGGGCGCN
ncbi:MAG: DUF4266 domain-containing protein [Pseudomonadales bacterium]|nr:DUF4266 domain-containing protein [Pseudomonadales bacterium]